jgi:protein TonB
MMARTGFQAAIVLTASFTFLSSAFASDDRLTRAKDLYLSAAYEDALTLLDGMTSDGVSPEGTEAAEYRVFCLLALQRSADAHKAIEAVVAADPFYVPSEGQASPRIRTIFREVRQGLLPVIVQRSYSEAKTAFDRKDPQTLAMFERLLTLLDDPDLKDMAVFTDLRMVATGFRDLSRAMASPRQEPAAETRADSQASSLSTGAAMQAINSNVPSPVDAPLVPPVVVFQQLPRWTPARVQDRAREFNGTLEIMIDEEGKVVAATISKSIHPIYDQELLRAARTWKFKPATKGGKPTRYLKVIDIQLRPTT